MAGRQSLENEFAPWPDVTSPPRAKSSGRAANRGTNPFSFASSSRPTASPRLPFLSVQVDAPGFFLIQHSAPPTSGNRICSRRLDKLAPCTAYSEGRPDRSKRERAKEKGYKACARGKTIFFQGGSPCSPSDICSLTTPSDRISNFQWIVAKDRELGGSGKGEGKGIRLEDSLSSSKENTGRCLAVDAAKSDRVPTLSLPGELLEIIEKIEGHD